MILPFIAVTNNSTLVDDDDVRRTLRVLQHHVNYDFGLYWNAGCVLKFVPDKTTLPEDSWHLDIRDEGKYESVGGMHWMLKDNTVKIEVYAGESTLEHPWTTSASHEILEALANPWASWCWLADDKGESMFVALEVCDPVEDDTYKCDLEGHEILVSNFVLPNWFREGSRPNYDFLGLCKAPLEVREGGSWTRFKARDGWKCLRADGRKIRLKPTTPTTPKGPKAEKAAEPPDKRISEYLFELVKDPQLMKKYWQDRDGALQASGLPTSQRKILATHSYAKFMQAVRSDAGIDYRADFMGPDHLMPDFRARRGSS